MRMSSGKCSAEKDQEGAPMNETNLGEHIVRMRGARTQAEFAKELHVTQAAVSAWERNDQKRTPSADVYFRLASLADDPEEALFFLGLAGLSPEALVSVAGRVLGDRLEPPVGSTVVAVGAKSAPPLASGDTVVIDTSESASSAVKPFWNLVILAEFIEEGRIVAPGLYMGRVGLRRLPHGMWLAELSIPTRDPDAPELNVWVGAWYPPSGLRSRAEERKRALVEMQVRPEWRILGRVMAWIPA
jgi:transcriptional regulator with XRE-family HTH domain